ncbi:MAG: LPXTG cell wall anchor domain-containing protein [Chloroflexota bacterium]
MARYNANGSLDTSFGTGGKVTTGLQGSPYGSSVAIQSDGRIVVGYGNSFALARYMAGEPAPTPTPTPTPVPPTPTPTLVPGVTAVGLALLGLLLAGAGYLTLRRRRQAA